MGMLLIRQTGHRLELHIII
uniref:Uncharacterized protein n=1 Tax=Arundo donax TaxID=35708 RepID=A0A0A9DZR5_ARUDO